MNYRLKKQPVSASELAEFLETQLVGDDFIVYLPGEFSEEKLSVFEYIESKDDYIRVKAKKADHYLLVVKPEMSIDSGMSVLLSNNPKLDFIRIVENFYLEKITNTKSNTSLIDNNAKIGENVHIGEYSIIGPDVIIGDNSIIANNVVINGRVEIGRNCIIKDNSTIGSVGFDFAYDEHDVPVTFPSIGKIIIEDYVMIGSITSIESPSLKDTIIRENVKIDDLVQVGAGTIIQRNSMVSSGVVLCRDVLIMNNVVIGPGSIIKENLVIDSNSLIGIGSAVIANTEENTIIAGNPAKVLKRGR